MTPISFGLMATLPIVFAMALVHLIFGALAALPM